MPEGRLKRTRDAYPLTKETKESRVSELDETEKKSVKEFLKAHNIDESDLQAMEAALLELFGRKANEP